MPRFHQPLTLLQRLFLLVAFALLPAVLLLVAAVAALRAQHEEAARDQARRIAAAAAARLERIIEGTRQTLLVLSETDAVRDGNPQSCERRLLTLGQHLPERIRLGILDPEGRPLCDTAGIAPWRAGSRDIAERHAPPRPALAMNSFTVVGFGPELAEPGARGDRAALALHLALPVRNARDGPLVGVVTAALGLPWLAAQLRSVGLPPGAELFLLDREGNVVLRLRAHPARSDEVAPPLAGTETTRALAALLAARQGRAEAREGRAAQGQTVPGSRLAALGAGAVPERQQSDGDASLLDAVGPDGAPRIFALAYEMASAQGALRLAVSLDAAAALAPVTEVGRRWALLVALGLAASLIAAWLGAQRFVLAPIRALQETARRWARGEYGARAAPALAAPPPEFARLAAALDRVAEAAEQRDRAAAALAEKEARLSLALEAGGLGAWELDPRSGTVERSPQHDALFGYSTPQAKWSYRRMLRHVVPEDRARVEAAFRRAVAEASSLRTECRIRPAGEGNEVRWLEATGAPHRGPDGRMKFLGVILDTTERRRTEERLRLVAGELNHRVKNTLAAVQSIAAQTLRWPAGDVPAAEASRSAFQARLLALARSHELLTREGWSGADLAELATLVLAPHAGAREAGGTAAQRVTIAGPPVRLAPRCTIPLAMALHELATNAARHGALSVPEGQVAVRWSVRPPPPPAANAAEDARTKGAAILLLRWEESGGPPLAGPPVRRGFGTRLLERGLATELHGTVRLEFAREGLRCEIEAPLSAAPDENPMATPVSAPPQAPAKAA
ncbi:MAG: PAS domain-containing protein [Acetobacteraceae bacterium]|nr:PAS domain-containing protein [Acetobacteraceae bacterium]